MRADNVALNESVSRRRRMLRGVGHLADVDPSIASRVVGGAVGSQSICQDEGAS